MDGGMFAIVNFTPGEYLLYSKHSGGKFAIWKVYYTTPERVITVYFCRGNDICCYR
jgi:hypothetical protein